MTGPETGRIRQDSFKSSVTQRRLVDDNRPTFLTNMDVDGIEGPPRNISSDLYYSEEAITTIANFEEIEMDPLFVSDSDTEGEGELNSLIYIEINEQGRHGNPEESSEFEREFEMEEVDLISDPGYLSRSTSSQSNPVGMSGMEQQLVFPGRGEGHGRNNVALMGNKAMRKISELEKRTSTLKELQRTHMASLTTFAHDVGHMVNQVTDKVTTVQINTNEQILALEDQMRREMNVLESGLQGSMNNVKRKMTDLGKRVGELERGFKVSSRNDGPPTGNTRPFDGPGIANASPLTGPKRRVVCDKCGKNLAKYYLRKHLKNKVCDRVLGKGKEYPPMPVLQAVSDW